MQNPMIHGKPPTLSSYSIRVLNLIISYLSLQNIQQKRGTKYHRLPIYRIVLQLLLTSHKTDQRFFIFPCPIWNWIAMCWRDKEHYLFHLQLKDRFESFLFLQRFFESKYILHLLRCNIVDHILLHEKQLYLETQCPLLKKISTIAMTGYFSISLRSFFISS